MYYADLIRETTTTTGTGTITLAGAVGQYQAFQTRVQVGDPVAYGILDANGTGWEIGEGTLASSTTISRGTVLESSNSDAAITLSTGTHTVFMSFNADAANKRLAEADAFIDYVVTGLALPTSSGTLTGTLTAGIAYAVGQRIKKGAQANTYTASKDTYVDLSNVGVLTYSAVANGAGAPALTANSIRLGYVVTGASTITSAVQTGKDSLGNVMFNTVKVPACVLSNIVDTVSAPDSTQTALTFGTNAVEFDNDGMHSKATNTSRITIQHAGLYLVSALVEWKNLSVGGFVYITLYKNGSATVISNGFSNPPGYPYTSFSGAIVLAAGDYLEAKVDPTTGSTQSVFNFAFSAVKV